MISSTQAVQRHLDAAWSYQWDELASSMAEGAELLWKVGSVERHSMQDASGLYRNISQAWDFLPGTVELNDRGNGIVEAELYLTNGPNGGWAKKVRGEYRVAGSHIVRIVLCDDVAFEVKNG